MKCSHCGTDNAADGRFCQRCGDPLYIEEETDAKIQSHSVTKSTKVKVKVTPSGSHAPVPDIKEPENQEPAPSPTKESKKRKTMRVAISSMMIIVLCATSALGVYFYMGSKINALNKQVTEQTKELEENRVAMINLNNERLGLKDALAKNTENFRLEQYRPENLMLQEKASFLDESIVLVTETGKKYHKYDCHYFRDCKSFWAYNTEAAVSEGYRPCNECIG